MRYEELIRNIAESAGLDYTEPPSGSYARLTSNGRAVAWAIPLDGGYVRFDLRRPLRLEELPEELRSRVAALYPHRWWIGAGGNAQFRVRVQTYYGTRDALDVAAVVSELLVHLASLPALPRRARRAIARAVLATERRFGVELECFGIGAVEAGRALEGVGLPLRGRGRWLVSYDSTVSGTGLEIKTPPLSGQSGLDELKRGMDALRAAGARVNRTCGTHVHFEVTDVGVPGMKKFVRSWVNNQRLLHWLVSPSRRNGRWCHDWQETSITALERAPGNQLRGADKYRNVNVLPFARQGTVEVRAHQGTMEFPKIEAWIRLCLALIDHSVSTAVVDAKTSLRDLFGEVNLDTNFTDYLLNRATRDFGAPQEVTG